MSCGDSVLLFPCLHREWSRIPHYPFQLVGNCSPYHNHRMFQQRDRVMIDKESVTLISIHTLLHVSNSRNTPPLLTSFHKQTQISNSQIHGFTVFKCHKTITPHSFLPWTSHSFWDSSYVSLLPSYLPEQLFRRQYHGRRG